jgi:hypothetical protein
MTILFAQHLQHNYIVRRLIGSRIIESAVGCNQKLLALLQQNRTQNTSFNGIVLLYLSHLSTQLPFNFFSCTYKQQNPFPSLAKVVTSFTVDLFAGKLCKNVITLQLPLNELFWKVKPETNFSPDVRTTFQVETSCDNSGDFFKLGLGIKTSTIIRRKDTKTEWQSDGETEIYRENEK